MTKRIFRFLINEVVYNGHLQSLGAASVVYIASVILGYQVVPMLFVLAYLIFQTIYFHDRYQGFYHDRATNEERTKHLKQYYHGLPLLISLFFLLTAAILLYVAQVPVLIFSALVLVLGVLYPMLLKDVTKYVPLFKNFYVSAVFALLVFLPSIYWTGEVTVNALSIVLFTFILVESMILQIVLDIKDRQSDGERGLRTLAVLLQPWQLLVFLWGMNFLVLAAAIFTVVSFPPYRLVAVLAIVTFPLNGCMLSMVAKQNRTGYILAASQYLVWPFVLMALAHE